MLCRDYGLWILLFISVDIGNTFSSTNGSIYYLTHWDRDKMAAIFKTAFSKALIIKCLNSDWNFTEICTQGSSEQYSSSGSDNSSAPSRRHAIICSNQWWSVYRRIYASLGPSEFEQNTPDSNVHGANMGPTWVLSAPDGPHVGPMNLAIRNL